MIINLKDSNEIMTELGIKQGSHAHAYFTDICAKEMDPFVPFKSGNLADYRLTVDEIHYEQPYAEYQYFGMRRDGTHIINPAKRDRSKHAQATSYWDLKMISAKKDKIIEDMQEYIKKHGGG